jgi:hypothetical protein
MAMYRQVLERLSTGGKTLEADLADIEAGKERAIASGQASLIRGGLGGTTVTGAVPLAAEKTAGRARLRARGGAESRYMTALMSFANLAEASRQAELERRAAKERTLMGARSREVMQIRGMQGQRQPGLDVFGKPMAGSMAAIQADYMRQQMSQPGGGYAQQFPAMYNQPTGDMPGGEGGVGATWERPDISFEEPFWGESEAWRAKQPGWVTGAGTVEDKAEQVVTAGLPSSAQRTESTIAEYLRQHGLDPTSTDPALMGRARELQRQWAAQYR